MRFKRFADHCSTWKFKPPHSEAKKDGGREGKKWGYKEGGQNQKTKRNFSNEPGLGKERQVGVTQRCGQERKERGGGRRSTQT